MGRAFRQGVVVGILGPLVFLAALVGWIYRYTRKVPFPVGGPAEGELTIRLVDPQEVPSLWQQWKAELEPIIARFCALGKDLKARWDEHYMARIRS